MNAAGILLLSIVLLALQSSGSFPFVVGPVSADLALCLVVHLALTRGLAAGGGLVVAVGYITDLASGAPSGLHVVTFTVVFLLGMSVRQRIFLDTPPATLATAGAASLLTTLLTWSLTAVFLRDYVQYRSFAVLSLPRALLTAPYIFLVRAAALRIDARTLSTAGRTVVPLEPDQT